jgi:hypothetical protein
MAREFGESKKARIFNVVFTNPDGNQILEKYNFQLIKQFGRYGTKSFPPQYFVEIPEQHVVVPPTLYPLKDGCAYRLTGPNSEERFTIERKLEGHATTSGKKD